MTDKKNHFGTIHTLFKYGKSLGFIPIKEFHKVNLYNKKNDGIGGFGVSDLIWINPKNKKIEYVFEIQSHFSPIDILKLTHYPDYPLYTKRYIFSPIKTKSIILYYFEDKDKNNFIKNFKKKLKISVFEKEQYQKRKKRFEEKEEKLNTHLRNLRGIKNEI